MCIFSLLNSHFLIFEKFMNFKIWFLTFPCDLDHKRQKLWKLVFSCNLEKTFIRIRIELTKIYFENLKTSATSCSCSTVRQKHIYFYLNLRVLNCRYIKGELSSLLIVVLKITKNKIIKMFFFRISGFLFSYSGYWSWIKK